MGKQKNRKSHKGRYNQAIYEDNLRRRSDFLDFEMVSIRDFSYHAPEFAKRQRSGVKMLQAAKKKYRLFSGQYFWFVSRYDERNVVVVQVKLLEKPRMCYRGFASNLKFSSNITWTKRDHVLREYEIGSQLTLSQFNRYMQNREMPTLDKACGFTTRKAAFNFLNSL